MWSRPYGAPMTTFREAVEKHDLDAVEDLLADEVVFRSPVAFKPYPGKAITQAILRTVFEVFENFRYIREINDGNEQALLFEAEVDGKGVTGCDFITVNDEGRIVDFMVMVRPLSGAQALADAMGARFADIQANALAWSERTNA